MNQTSSNPRTFAVTLLTPAGENVIEVAEDEHIWDAAAARGIKLPALCHQGWCLTCAGRIVGNGQTDQSDSVAFFPQDRNAGFALLCTGKAHADLRIRTNQANEMRRHRLEHRLPAPYSIGLLPES